VSWLRAIPTSSTLKGYPVIVGPNELHQNRVAGNGSRPCEEFANPSPLSKELFLSIEIGNCNATSPPFYGNRFLGRCRDVRPTNDIFRKSIEEFVQINVMVLDISLSELRPPYDVNSDVLVGGNCDGLGSEDGCFFMSSMTLLCNDLHSVNVMAYICVTRLRIYFALGGCNLPGCTDHQT
jgi:hypothetical protein